MLRRLPAQPPQHLVGSSPGPPPRCPRTGRWDPCQSAEYDAAFAAIHSELRVCLVWHSGPPGSPVRPLLLVTLRSERPSYHQRAHGNSHGFPDNIG